MFSTSASLSIHPPITTIALSSTAATATKHLADDDDPTLLHESSELSYILISPVDVPSLLFHPPTITGGDEPGTKAVCE